MFLSLLKRRNPAFLQGVAALHAAGELPPNCTVVDLDALGRNTRNFAAEARRLGLRPFAMTKQIGRNPDALAVIAAHGVDEAVGVDLECAIAARVGGLRTGHLGHLVQIPRHRCEEAAALEPRYWTVFSHDKAREAGAASTARGRVQDVLLRVAAPGDRFYRGHEGGFPADGVVDAVGALAELDGVRFAGLTTFPALLFDADRQTVALTPNVGTLQAAAARLAAAGVTGIEVNAPGTTSTATLAMLAEAGATQVEPGHGLTGTTPWHAVRDLVEDPAVTYLSEVSHSVGDEAFAFGGGLYADPVLGRQPARALVFRAGDTVADAEEFDVDMPAPEAIDYYAPILGAGRRARPGDTVLFGFRPQVFVTRSYTAGVRGVGTGSPTVAGIWSADGSSPLTTADALVRRRGGS